MSDFENNGNNGNNENNENNENNNYQESQTPKPKGHGWKITAIVLSVALFVVLVLGVFAAGTVILRLFPQGGNKQLNSSTARPIATKAAQATIAPASTLPQIGSSSALALGEGIDIPSIVKADGSAVVGVTTYVKSRSSRSFTATDVENDTGSGIIISSDGYIVTNNHVVAGGDRWTVVLPGGDEVPADLVGTDAQTDLAVLKINKTGLTTIHFGNSDNVEVGETVIAIGNPLGTDLAGTVTAGIISARDRVIPIDGYTFKLLQTDAAINPGNSGGALVDAKGDLIGINNLKSISAGTDNYGQTISAEGIGFAIPINDAKPIIEQLIKYHGIDRPVFGIINPAEVSQEQMQFNNWPAGVGIPSVTDNGPAMQAGMQAGDIITEIDGVKVAALTDIHDILDKHKIGDTIKVTVFRTTDGQVYTFNLTLGSSMAVNQ